MYEEHGGIKPEEWIGGTCDIEGWGGLTYTGGSLDGLARELDL